MNNNNTENMTMKAKDLKAVPRRLDLRGAEFIKRKGLTRDKANWVTLMVRLRADMKALERLVSDPDVLMEIATVADIVEDSVQWMYESMEPCFPYNGGPHDGGGKAA